MHILYGCKTLKIAPRITTISGIYLTGFKFYWHFLYIIGLLKRQDKRFFFALCTRLVYILWQHEINSNKLLSAAAVMRTLHCLFFLFDYFCNVLSINNKTIIINSTFQLLFWHFLSLTTNSSLFGTETVIW